MIIAGDQKSWLGQAALELTKQPAQVVTGIRFRAIRPEKVTQEAASDRFRAAASALESAAAALVGASAGGTDAAVEKAVLGLHERYLDLEKVFD